MSRQSTPVLAVASEEARRTKGLRILLLDPIGHVLGHHDHAICEELAGLGHVVALGTNQPEGAGTAGAYRRFLPYGRISGDGSRVAKALNYLRAWRRILHEVESFRPDVVVLYYVMETRLDRLFLRKLGRRGIATVVCAHDVLPLGDADGARLPAYRRIYEAASGVMVFSQYAREQLAERFAWPASRSAAAWFGIDGIGQGDPSREEARARLGIARDEQTVLCFGQIKRNKDLDVLLRAFASAAAAHPRARLRIVGRPWYVDLSASHELARALGIADRVAFHPQSVPEAEVGAWFQASDLVVLPYTRIYQSAVLNEAVARARPVVATAIGSMPELLADGDAAWLVPPRDAGALARALDDALADPAEALRRGRAAQERAQRRCTWSSFAASFTRFLESIVSAKASGSLEPVRRRARISILGTRGIPANYGGFETFAEELAARLAKRGHDVTCYGRTHYIPRTLKEHRGVRLINLPTIASKHLDTVVHAFLSALHVMFRRCDVVLMCNVVNSPFCLFPRLVGKKVLLNVDGMDWDRKKWNRIGRFVSRFGARMSVWVPHRIITDAVCVQNFYRERFDADSSLITYGSKTLDAPRANTGILEKVGVKPREYILYVSRLEPENNAALVVEAFEGVKTDKKLLIVGTAPYSREYIEKLKSTKDPRIIFPGGIYGEPYVELQQNCYLYIQASEVGGVHPAMVEGMGAGNCVVYNDVIEHVETCGDAGVPYTGVLGLRARLQELVEQPERVAALGAKAKQVARERYDWEKITDQYEQLCFDVMEGRRPRSGAELSEASA